MRTPFNGKALALSGVLLAALVSSPASASAQSCVAPPGTAGIDQYCESIPGADGSHGPSDRSGSGAGGGTGSLPGNTRRTLGRAGPDGKALLGIAGSTAPQRHGTAHGNGGGTQNGPGARPPQGTAPKPASGNPLAAVGKAVKNGAEAGPGFVWMLVVLGLGIAGLAWLRFRRAAARG